MKNNNKKKFINSLDSEIAGNLNKNYELFGKNYLLNIRELKKKNLSLIADNSGARMSGENQFIIEFFDKEVMVDLENEKIIDFKSSDNLDIFSSTLILSFMLQSDGEKLSGEWIQYRELPDGLFYATTIPGVLQLIIKKYESDGSGFIDRIVEMGGEINDRFQHAGILYPFRRFPMMFIMEEKDEEFDASARVLFDKSAPHYLKTDVIKTLLVYTVKKIIK
jgi:hypothetical protein